MFEVVNRRNLRKIVCLLVALQAFLSAPMGSAFAAMAGPADPANCEGMMTDTGAPDSCPCCPEGDMGTAACLSACAASAGAVQTLAVVQARAMVVFAAPRVHADVATPDDAPLTPPPIV